MGASANSQKVTIRGKSPKFIAVVISAAWLSLLVISTDENKLTVEFVVHYVLFSALLTSPAFVFLSLVLSFRLELNDDVFNRGLFGNQKIATKKIIKVTVESGYKKSSKHFGFIQRLFLPPFRIVFYPSDVRTSPVVINRALLTRSGEQQLMQWISDERIPIIR
jgi:hypothetical protein